MRTCTQWRRRVPGSASRIYAHKNMIKKKKKKTAQYKRCALTAFRSPHLGNLPGPAGSVWSLARNSARADVPVERSSWKRHPSARNRERRTCKTVGEDRGRPTKKKKKMSGTRADRHTRITRLRRRHNVWCAARTKERETYTKRVRETIGKRERVTETEKGFDTDRCCVRACVCAYVYGEDVAAD